MVLTGEGSDELLGGYGRYRFYQLNERWMKLYSRVPGRLRAGVRSALATHPLLSADLKRKLEHTVLGRDTALESLYLDNFYCAFGAGEQERLLIERCRNNPYGFFLRYWDSAVRSPALNRLLYVDQKTYLVELLMKQDQMSMACSIESRVPFLDHKFVEFAATVPPHMKVRGKEGKYILKKAVGRSAPAQYHLQEEARISDPYPYLAPTGPGEAAR